VTAAVDPGVRMRAWAADLMIKAGWQLAPCRIVLRPNNAGELKKMPVGLMNNWQNLACRTVEEFDAACAEVNRHAGGPATGYLISCGPSGIVAADADGPAGIATLAGLDVPTTMTVDTPHGMHAIYAADPTKPVRNSQVAGPGLDIRGVGGGLFGPGSIVLAPDGTVAGEWRARYPVIAPVIMPAAIAAIGATAVPDRSAGNVRDLPPAARRDPSSPADVTRAMEIATKYFQVMQDECERPTGRWNGALYDFTRWMGRWVATRGYEDIDSAIDAVRFAVVQSMMQNPLMTEPDDKDAVTISGKAAVVGLRQGPYESNEPPEVSPLWGDPNPGEPGSPAAEQPGVQPAEQPDAIKAMISKIMTADQLRARPKPPPLITGFIDAGRYALLYGAPGSLKSFVAIDMLACISNGIDWHGHTVRRANTLYVAAEGGGDVDKRLTAWENKHRMPSGVLVYPEPIDLYAHARGKVIEPTTPQISTLLAVMRQLRIEVVCFDTLNRCTPGMEENSSMDSSIVNARVQEFTKAGMTVIMVHHTPRDGSNPRGSTAIEGATDHGIRVDRPNRHGMAVKVTNERQKDHADGGGLDLVAAVDLDADSLYLSGTAAEVALSPEQESERAVLAWLSEADAPQSERDIVRAQLGKGAGRHPERKAAVAALVERGLIAAVDSVPGIRGGKAVAVGASRFELTDLGKSKLISVDTIPAPPMPNAWMSTPDRLTSVDTVDKSEPP
jgi:AAA domain/Bifunctional DNA primase/polymerase, N-terminal